MTNLEIENTVKYLYACLNAKDRDSAEQHWWIAAEHFKDFANAMFGCQCRVELIG